LKNFWRILAHLRHHRLVRMPFAPKVKAEFRSNDNDDNIATVAGNQQEDESIDLNSIQDGHDDMQIMERMGLPTTIMFGTASTSPKKNREKQNFSCRVCNIEDLNSLETKTKHENGKDHIYNIYKAYSKGQLLPEEREDNPFLQVFEGGEVAPRRQAGRSKTCQRLNEIVGNNHAGELLVGMEHVTEIIACSSVEDPYYECNLCSSQGLSDQMYIHLLSSGHRKTYLRTKKPHVNVDNETVILGELEQFRQDDCSKISTLYSDERYPWEYGKAPWCAERGGTGEIPSGARDAGDGIMISGQVIGRGGLRDSKASARLQNMKTYKDGFSQINIGDTVDVRIACDLATEIIRKLNQEQQDMQGRDLVNAITSAIYTNLSAQKGLGHADDGGEVPGLWEMETENRRIKEERNDESTSHGNPGGHTDDRRRRSYDDRRGSSSDRDTRRSSPDSRGSRMRC